MRTCVDYRFALPHIDNTRVQTEARFLATRLELLRQQLIRARHIEVKHSGLNNAIEKGRAS
jgi:hypothetical protein